MSAAGFIYFIPELIIAPLKCGLIKDNIMKLHVIARSY